MSSTASSAFSIPQPRADEAGRFTQSWAQRNSPTARAFSALAVGEFLCAQEGVKRPASSALGCGIENALEAVEDIARRERPAVVELYAASKVKRVGEAVGGNVPCLREPRHNLSIGSEPDEPVENVSDGSARWHVGR